MRSILNLKDGADANSNNIFELLRMGDNQCENNLGDINCLKAFEGQSIPRLMGALAKLLYSANNRKNSAKKDTFG